MARCTCARFRFLNAIAAILFLVGVAAFAQDTHVEFKNGVFTLVGWQGKIGDEPPAAGWDSVLAVYAAGADTPMRLQLHAREIIVPLYKNKDPIRVEAPAPADMCDRLAVCGWQQSPADP